VLVLFVVCRIMCWGTLLGAVVFVELRVIYDMVFSLWCLLFVVWWLAVITHCCWVL